MKITKSLLTLLISVSIPAFGQDITPQPDLDPIPTRDEPDNIRNEGDLNTNQIGSNNNNRTTNNTGPNAGSRLPANTAVSPSLMSSGTESCLQSISGGLQLVGIGVSSGKYIQDEECNRRRNGSFFNVSKRRRVAGNASRGNTLSSGKIREDNCWQAGNARD